MADTFKQMSNPAVNVFVRMLVFFVRLRSQGINELIIKCSLDEPFAEANLMFFNCKRHYFRTQKTEMCAAQWIRRFTSAAKEFLKQCDFYY